MAPSIPERLRRSTALDRWQNDLTEKDVATIEYFAGDGMTQHGYVAKNDYKLSLLELVDLFIRRAHRKLERTLEKKKFNLL